MKRVCLLALVVSLGVAASPAEAAPRCVTPTGHTVVASSPGGVVYESPVRPGFWVTSLRMCSRSTGRVHELEPSRTTTDDSRITRRYLAAGSYIAIVERLRDRYSTDLTTAVVYDSRTGALLAPRRTIVDTSSVDLSDPVRFVGVAVGGQIVAQTRERSTSQRGEELFAHVGDDRVQLVEPQPEPIEDVRIDGDIVSWTVNGVRSERQLPPIAPPDVRCDVPPGYRIAAIGVNGALALEYVDGPRHRILACSWSDGRVRELGTFTERQGRRIERVVAGGGNGAVAVFERGVRGGRARIRARSIDIVTGRLHAGWTTPRMVPDAALELVDVDAGDPGVAWSLRVGPQLRVGAVTGRRVLQLDKGPLRTRLGDVSMGFTNFNWFRGDRELTFEP
jgi:hypothetical protein